MTFRQAEFDIRCNYSNADDIVEALKEMIRTNNEYISHEGRDIARGYFKGVNECRKKSMPKIEVTDKQARQIVALKGIGTPIYKIAIRFGFSKPTVYRVLREEKIIK